MSMARRLKYKLPIILVVFVLSGCSGSLSKLKGFDNIEDQLDNLSLPLQTPKGVSSHQFDVTRFNTCMAPLSANMKNGFKDLIRSVKNDSVTVENPLLGNTYQMGDENLLTAENSLHPVVKRLFDRLLNRITFDQSLGDGAGKIARFKNLIIKRFENDNNDVSQNTIQASGLAKNYLFAYFTKGSVQTANEILQDDDFKSQLAGVLNRKADDPAITKALSLIDDRLVKSSSKLTSKSTGFIAGDGSQFSFPGIQYQDSRIAVDHSQIGADIIRILLEAVRDTYAPIPVVDNASAAAAKAAPKLETGSKNTLSVSWQIDRNDSASVQRITLSQDDYEKLEANARKAEAFIATTVGKVIRGGSWGALNNEAVAKLVETLAGVVGRHVAERGQWCAMAQAKDS